MQVKKYLTQPHNLYLKISKATRNKSSNKLIAGICRQIPKEI